MPNNAENTEPESKEPEVISDQTGNKVGRNPKEPNVPPTKGETDGEWMPFKQILRSKTIKGKVHFLFQWENDAESWEPSSGFAQKEYYQRIEQNRRNNLRRKENRA